MATKSTAKVNDMAKNNEASTDTGEAERATSRALRVTPADIDRINLAQALSDFETANVRVVDLTGRLTALHQQLIDLQHRSSLAQLALGRTETQRSQLELERDAARAEAAELRASHSYRLGNLLIRAGKKVTP